VASLLLAGVWLGIVTGLVEGAGLLLFQRINWARWGPMIHVSAEILWISPLVDLLFFGALALMIGLIARLFPRLPVHRVLIFLLAFLATYDWLTLTGRLYHRACLLLALGVAVAFTRWFGKREDMVRQFWRRTAPWVIAAFLLALAGVQGGKWLEERSTVSNLPAPAPGSPNVLVIVIDTLRADYLSSYGHNQPTSPEIDRMAQQGVLFENAVAASSWSLPSHVSLLTGRYLFEHGVGNVQDGASFGGYPTLGELLELQGYRTGAFSANRTYFSRDLGFGRGFVHFEDYFHSPADMFVRTLYGREFSRIYLTRSEKSLVKRALRTLGFTSLLDQDAEGSGSYGGAFGIRKRVDVVNSEVLGWIDRDRQRPFFAFLNYFDVHDPYGGPKSGPSLSGRPRTTVEEYEDSVKYVDDYIGRLMRELEQRDRLKNTLVVITSDHGESLGNHGMLTHGRVLYWDLIRVPLIIWYPGHVPAGTRIARPVTNAAIPATIVDLLGTSGRGTFPGPALSALWKNPGADTGWPYPLSELAQNKYAGKQDEAVDKLIPTAATGSMKSLVSPQWHLIIHQGLGDQLYDWVHDPNESNNLADTPQGRTVVLDLKSKMQDILQKK
jgi:arylsulfatase A-like enzyme